MNLMILDPYPFAIDEAFDTYRLLSETGGKVIGMSGEKLNIIMSGDSASVFPLDNCSCDYLNETIDITVVQRLL